MQTALCEEATCVARRQTCVARALATGRATRVELQVISTEAAVPHLPIHIELAPSFYASDCHNSEVLLDRRRRRVGFGEVAP